VLGSDFVFFFFLPFLTVLWLPWLAPAGLFGMGKNRTNRYALVLCSIMRFGGRSKWSNEKLDENFSRNLSSNRALRGEGIFYTIVSFVDTAVVEIS
jgi:hypothetical protein